MGWKLLWQYDNRIWDVWLDIHCPDIHAYGTRTCMMAFLIIHQLRSSSSPIRLNLTTWIVISRTTFWPRGMPGLGFGDSLISMCYLTFRQLPYVAKCRIFACWFLRRFHLGVFKYLLLLKLLEDPGYASYAETLKETLMSDSPRIQQQTDWNWWQCLIKKTEGQMLRDNNKAMNTQFMMSVVSFSHYMVKSGRIVSSGAQVRRPLVVRYLLVSLM